MKTIIPTLALVICLLDASVFGADTKGETGHGLGVVFTADAAATSPLRTRPILCYKH